MKQMKSEVRDGMKIDWNMPITMDDGLVLRADVFRPVAEGRYPVIFSYGPYGKGVAFQEGYKTAWEIMARENPDAVSGTTNKYANWEVVDPEKWVPDGYICIRVDSRGAGRSPGYLRHNDARETCDIHLCIEWAAVQPWSNGRAGMNGISYYASNQWRAAASQPPHLAAICVWEGWADAYRDSIRHGGLACTFRKNWQDMQVKTVQHGVGERGRKSPVTGELACGPETLTEEELVKNREDMWLQVLARPLDSPYYRERTPDLSKVTVPHDGRGAHLFNVAACGRNRDHRALGAQALYLILHFRCRHFRSAPRVRPGLQGGCVSGRARPAHAHRPGMAARIAEETRCGAVAPLPPLPRARRKAAAHTGGSL